MAVNKEKIGAYMAALRRKKNLTQAELAESIGVSNKSVSRWETGQTLPDYEQMLKLCALLEVDLNELLSGEPAAASTPTSIPFAQEEPDLPASAASTPMAEEPDEESAAPVIKKPGDSKTAFRRWLPLLLLPVLLVLGVVLLGRSCRNRSDDMPIDEATFPDADFRAFVQSELIHAAPDRFTAAEADAVTCIDCSGRNIQSLAGVECFRALAELDCSANYLEALNLNENKELQALRCGNNLISSLDVKGCSKLKELDCQYNQLTELNTDSWPELVKLKCNNNLLAVLDLAKNTALQELECYCNQLTAIDLKYNLALTKFDAWQNRLVALDLSCQPALSYLNCDFNGVAALDLSNNPELETLYCSGNQLRVLDLSRQAKLKYLFCGQNALTELSLHPNASLWVLYGDANYFSALDLSNQTKLKSLLLDGNGITDLVLPKTMRVNTEDRDSFRIDSSVLVRGYSLSSDSQGSYFELGKLVALDHMDRVKVITSGASQPDAKGLVRFASKPMELTYVFETGFEDCAITVCISFE